MKIKKPVSHAEAGFFYARTEAGEGILKWNKDHTQMGDGVTLTPNEMRLFKKICKAMDYRSADGNT